MDVILEAFGVDAKLLLAQLLNFGILAFLLTKFLYKPMFKVLNERTKKAEEIETGAKEIAEARSDMETWRKDQRRSAKEEADDIIKVATVDAQKQRADILAKANTEAEALRDKASRSIELERDRVFQESQQELAGIALLAAEKVLGRETREDDTRRLAEEAVNALRR